MTDKQFKTMFQMFGMILDGCKDINDAKQKVDQLIKEQDNKTKEKKGDE